MPEPAMPTPWKRSKGNDKRLGYWERPFGDAMLVHDPAGGNWWLSMPRTPGAAGRGGDLWGNWEAPTAGEEDVVPLAAKLYARLVRAGWVQADHGFTEARKEALMRMGRGPEMPRYFLYAFDRENLARGRAEVSGRLRLAGADFHVDKPDMGGAFGMEKAKYVSVTYAERSRKHPSGVHMSLDRAEAQAVSDYFARLAAGMLTEEPWQDLLRARSDASHGSLGVGIHEDASAGKRHRLAETGRRMDDIARNLATLDLEQLRLVAIVTDVMRHGDVLTGVEFGAAGRRVQPVVTFDPDTLTVTDGPDAVFDIEHALGTGVVVRVRQDGGSEIEGFMPGDGTR